MKKAKEQSRLAFVVFGKLLACKRSKKKLISRSGTLIGEKVSSRKKQREDLRQ
jgi:hypothetical protein